MSSPRLFLFIAASALLASCSTTVQAPSASVGSVTVKGGEAVPSAGTAELQSENNSEAEMQMEGAVAKGCLEAWRKALKGDGKGAMSQLDDLGEKYPNVTTVVFMKGQVLERLGKKKEAIEFYKEAAGAKEFSTLHIFKLAEALRTTNQNQDAVVQYRRLIKLAPDFAPGHIGLAQSLLALNKNSDEAKRELAGCVASAKTQLETDPYSSDAKLCLEGVLKAEPDNKEAKELLAKMSKSDATSKSGASTKPANSTKVE